MTDHDVNVADHRPEAADRRSAAAGIETAERDPAIRPQDDLFRHVNGRWIERTDIPPDKARYGSFIELREQAEAAVRKIIEELPATRHASAEPVGGAADLDDAVDSDGAAVAHDGAREARKLSHLYASFMDSERIESLGVTPIEGLLAEVADIGSIPQLLGVIGGFEHRGIGSVVQLFVDNDPGDPERYLVFVEQAGIGLPDESYFRDEGFADIRTAYRGHLERMFALAGFDDAAGRAERVFELETAIAGHHWDNVSCRDSEKTYHLLRWDEVRALAARSAAEGGVMADGDSDRSADDRGHSGGSEAADSDTVGADLAAWRAGIDAPGEVFAEMVVRQPSFLEGLGALLTAERLPAWRDWLAWQVIHAFAPHLSSAFVTENFNFYGRTLTGAEQLRERWKRGVTLVEGAMGEAAGRRYVERHFPPESKAQMDELVGNLIAAYRASITALDWMGDETKQRALAKLEKFTPKIGYPVRWRNYSFLEIDPADLVGNVQAAAAFEFDREIGKIGRPIDRDEWLMTPQTVNAYYNPGFNEIVFPAAILQYPFFDPRRDAAADYGAIGAVIGHEIGHGFDDQGSKFDGDGRLTDWWTAADRAAFEKRTGSLIDQYDELAPAQVPGHYVNGSLTIGENIGDLGGLGIAWHAYLHSLGGAEPPLVDGMTGAQRFLLSWAQAWRQKGRDEEAIRLLAIDPHAPNEFRCNQIVRNLDVFYEAFDVGPDDALYLAPERRVAIW